MGSKSPVDGLCGLPNVVHVAQWIMHSINYTGQLAIKVALYLIGESITGDCVGVVHPRAGDAVSAGSTAYGLSLGFGGR